MRTNNLLYVTGLVVITTLLIIGGYLAFKDIDDPEYNNHLVNDPHVVVNMSEHIADRVEGTEFTTIKHNTNPKFKVGDIFEYEIYDTIISGGTITNAHGVSKEIFFIERMDRIEGEDYYLFISNREMHEPPPLDPLLLPPQVTDDPSDLTIEIRITERKDWIHKDTGRFLKTTMRSGVIKGGIKVWNTPTPSEVIIPEEISEVSGNIMYSPWMLALDDNFEMEINETFMGKEYTRVVRVIEREKVNNRDCFKTEMKMLDEDNRVISRDYLWVDIEKRILVKLEAYNKNLKLGEINLVSEL